MVNWGVRGPRCSLDRLEMGPQTIGSGGELSDVDDAVLLLPNHGRLQDLLLRFGQHWLSCDVGTYNRERVRLILMKGPPIARDGARSIYSTVPLTN